MSRKLSLTIGITLFILILCASYNESILSSKDNKNNEVKQEISTEIVYKGKFPIPIENFIKVTSKFGYREPIYVDGIQISGGKIHSGLDLVGYKDSKIISVANGEVTYAGWQNGYGNCVEIKHIDETGKPFYTFYTHMKDNSLQVITGQIVNVGQVIGIQGTTGNSTGDHLHFEIKTENKEKIDPAPYLFSEMEVSSE